MTEKTPLLDLVFGQRSKLAVLRCLTQTPDGVSGRELGRRTALSHQTAVQTLGDLVRSGIVLRDPIPPAYRFTLNRSHWIVREVVLPAFEKERGWLDSLIRELSRKPPSSLTSLILYGSAARGQMGHASDIDLIALARDGEKSELEDFFATRSSSIFSAYRRKISVMVYEIMNFKRLYRDRNRFVREVVNTGRVVSGKLLTEVLFKNGPSPRPHPIGISMRQRGIQIAN